MTCSMAVFWPSTTSVSRETCGSWMRPMVRLSIAKPRCRNRLTTRLSTDGWSSSVATSVCFIRDHLRQGGSHRPQSTAGQEAVGMVVVVVLGGEHLVLAHVGHHHRLAAGEPIQPVNHLRGVQAPTGLGRAELRRVLGLPAAQLLVPG